MNETNWTGIVRVKATMEFDFEVDESWEATSEQSARNMVDAEISGYIGEAWNDNRFEEKWETEADDTLCQFVSRTARTGTGYLRRVAAGVVRLRHADRRVCDRQHRDGGATMTDTVTVFVRLMGGAFPGAIEGDIRVYRNASDRPVPAGWIRFLEVPVQTERFGIIDLDDDGEAVQHAFN